MRRLDSLAARIIINHIIVATLTSVMLGLLLTAVLAFSLNSPASLAVYRNATFIELTQWQLGAPDGLPSQPGNPPGFSMVIAPDDTVIHTYGQTNCRAKMRLADCAPELVGRKPGEGFFDKNGQRWGEAIVATIGGQRIIAQYGPLRTDPYLGFGSWSVYGTFEVLGVIVGASFVLSLPVALVLGWFSARRVVRRLTKITQASRKFSAGDFTVRVGDNHRDEVGEMARQFDDMAGTLEQNVVVLRELAQRNAELTQQAEQAAIAAERVRLSRDLHDDIAQNLFSLSINASTLPAAIEREPVRSVAQAEAIAGLAEKTLLDLRALLVELRPSKVLECGLAEALERLCQEWQATYQTPVECSIVLTGNRLPAGVEDVLYRVVQEALNNVAKHARARSVHVSLVEGRRQITLSITDDGRGFAAATTGSGKFGLISMRERAHAVGGKLAIESDTNQGTTVRVILPLDYGEADR